MKKIILFAVILILAFPFGVSAIPSPVTEYDTVKQLKDAVDFTVYTPSALPKGYKLDSITTINGAVGGTLADINYKKGDSIICYRTAKYTKHDISGVYGEYNENSVLKIDELDGLKVSTRGDKGKVSVATFSAKKLSFSLYFETPVSTKTLTAIVKGIF